MKRLLLAAALAASLVPAAFADDQASQARIYRSVRHELVMLPQLTVFDNLAYKVDDGTVTLYGQVRNPVLKGEAASAVKKIEGVESVSNQIEVLPASFNDDRIRRREARAIYGYDGLFNYSLGTLPSIRIIVKNGNVTLEGVVDRQADKNIAGIRANGVPGVFSVTNHLKVEGSGSQN
ncbi:MAG TPA: BON domain-containing protein [Candidatus Angelobacter sp.]|nr:BON domain-containing protein [Candidatus Angelobacter sp.]